MKKNVHVDVLNDGFSRNGYASLHNHSDIENIDEGSATSCGIFTNIEGIMAGILTHIENMKSRGAGIEPTTKYTML